MHDPFNPQPLPAHMAPITPRLSHRRHPSGELDVFEASRYMSGCTDADGFTDCRPTVEQRSSSQNHPAVEEPPQLQLHHPHSSKNSTPANTKKVSHGGLLTRFFASLFHHHGSGRSRKDRKAKSIKSDDEEDSGNRGSKEGRRRRRRRGSTSDLLRSSSASVSSEPTGPTRLHPLADLHKARAGGAPLWEMRSKRVYVREQLAEYGCSGPAFRGDGQAERIRWTLNQGAGGMVVVEDAPPAPMRRRGHLWRREEEDHAGGRGGEESDGDSSGDLFELPVFSGTTATPRAPIKG